MAWENCLKEQPKYSILRAVPICGDYLSMSFPVKCLQWKLTKEDMYLWSWEACVSLRKILTNFWTLPLVSHMVIEEVNCIQNHLEIEKTCRESAEALASKVRRIMVMLVFLVCLFTYLSMCLSKTWDCMHDPYVLLYNLVELWNSWEAGKNW